MPIDLTPIQLIWRFLVRKGKSDMAEGFFICPTRWLQASAVGSSDGSDRFAGGYSLIPYPDLADQAAVFQVDPEQIKAVGYCG